MLSNNQKTSKSPISIAIGQVTDAIEDAVETATVIAKEVYEVATGQGKRTGELVNNTINAMTTSDSAQRADFMRKIYDPYYAFSVDKSIQDKSTPEFWKALAQKVEDPYSVPDEYLSIAPDAFLDGLLERMDTPLADLSLEQMFDIYKLLDKEVREGKAVHLDKLKEQIGAAGCVGYYDIFNEVGTFKLRGVKIALIRLEKLLKENNLTLVCASTGSFAFTTARCGKEKGISVEVFMPSNRDIAKQNKVEGEDAKVTIIEGDFDRAKEESKFYAGRNPKKIYRLDDGTERGIAEGPTTIIIDCVLKFMNKDINDFENVDQFKNELRKLVTDKDPRMNTIFFKPAANLAGATGCGRAIKVLNEECGTNFKFVSVCGEGSPVVIESLRAGRPVYNCENTTELGAIAVRVLDLPAFKAAQEFVSAVVCIKERNVVDGMGISYINSGFKVEPAAGSGFAAVAGLSSGTLTSEDVWLNDENLNLFDLTGQYIVIISTGENFDPKVYPDKLFKSYGTPPNEDKLRELAVTSN